jgi:DNA primase
LIERTLGVLDHYGLLDEAQVKRIEVTILCPFHQENTPSCTVDLDKELWYCHGCGQGGTLLNFVSRLEGSNDLKALRVLSQIDAGTAGIGEIKGVKLALVRENAEVDSETARQQSKDYFLSLYKTPWQDIRYHYLLSRGFKPATLIHFDVRNNPSSDFPIAFPIRENGKFQGYMTRALDERPDKYRMSKGLRKSEVLDGNITDGSIVLLVEGKLDQMRAWQNGWPDTVTALNWALSDAQLEKLGRAKGVICGLDNDRAGEEGYARLSDAIKTIPVVRYSFPPWVKDHGEMLKPEFDVGMRKALHRLNAA